MKLAKGYYWIIVARTFYGKKVWTKAQWKTPIIVRFDSIPEVGFFRGEDAFYPWQCVGSCEKYATDEVRVLKRIPELRGAYFSLQELEGEKMTSNKDVAKRFANADWSKGGELNGSHCFIRDKIIYSYGEHFPIAMWLDFPYTVLWNKDKYSVTTGKHKREVGSALNSAYPGHERVQVSTSEFRSIVSQAASGKNKVMFITRSPDPKSFDFTQMNTFITEFLKSKGVCTRTANRLAKESVNDWEKRSMLSQV